MQEKINVYLYEKSDILIISFLIDKLIMNNIVAIAEEGRQKVKNFEFKHIIIDTHRLTKIDSTGLGYILEIRNIALKEKQGEFLLVITNDAIMSLYNEVGIDDFVKQFDSIEEASEYITNQKQSLS